MRIEVLPGLMALHVLLTFGAFTLGGWRAAVVVFVGSFVLAVALQSLYWSWPTRKHGPEACPGAQEGVGADGG